MQKLEYLCPLSPPETPPISDLNSFPPISFNPSEMIFRKLEINFFEHPTDSFNRETSQQAANRPWNKKPHTSLPKQNEGLKH